MAKPFVPFSINAPGALGLNKKHERLDIGAQWCTEATNAVIDASGVLGVRHGWSAVNSTAITGSPNPRTIFEYIDSTDTSRILTAAGNKIYEGTTTLTDVTGTVTAPTADNWKFVNFNGKVVGVQAGHAPIVKSGSGNFADISFSTDATYTGTLLDKPYEALSAWGRVWYVNSDGKTLFWSDLLQEDILPQATAPGSSGVLNLWTVWGGDKIVALAAFNDYLVIFGREHIVLYSGTEDPNTSLAIADIIYGTGCIARDSVQNTGNDILFLGPEGLSSLARNVQDGSLPLTNLSENVRDYLATFSQSETADNIKSAYKTDEGFYLLSFPGSDQVFYFNFKFRTPDGLPRVTNWKGIKPTALCALRSGKLYLGRPGHIAEYKGYRDNSDTYELKVKTGWIKGTEDIASMIKIPKEAIVTVKGGYSAVLHIEWGYDYNVSEDSSSAAVEHTSSPAEFNVAEYNVAEYTGLNAISALIFRLTGTGRTIQVSFRYTVDGSEILIQRADLFIKIGRVY